MHSSSSSVANVVASRASLLLPFILSSSLLFLHLSHDSVDVANVASDGVFVGFLVVVVVSVGARLILEGHVLAHDGANLLVHVRPESPPVDEERAAGEDGARRDDRGDGLTDVGRRLRSREASPLGGSLVEHHLEAGLALAFEAPDGVFASHLLPLASGWRTRSRPRTS